MYDESFGIGFSCVTRALSDWASRRRRLDGNVGRSQGSYSRAALWYFTHVHYKSTCMSFCRVCRWIVNSLAHSSNFFEGGCTSAPPDSPNMAFMPIYGILPAKNQRPTSTESTLWNIGVSNDLLSSLWNLRFMLVFDKISWYETVMLNVEKQWGNGNEVGSMLVEWNRESRL